VISGHVNFTELTSRHYFILTSSLSPGAVCKGGFIKCGFWRSVFTMHAEEDGHFLCESISKHQCLHGKSIVSIHLISQCSCGCLSACMSVDIIVLISLSGCLSVCLSVYVFSDESYHVLYFPVYTSTLNPVRLEASQHVHDESG